jgi:transposase
MLPQAYVYPHEMQSTRDLLRRRQYFVNQHAELLTHIQITRHQCNLPVFEKRIDRISNRKDINLLFDDPMVRTSVEVDVKLLDTYHQHIVSIEQKIAAEVEAHDSVAYQLLRTVPGIGKILGTVILYKIHDINRFSSVKHFISYARLIKCSHESGGTRSTGKNAKIGNAHLKWAFGEAACLFLRDNEAGQRYHEKLERKYGKAKALSIIAQKLGRTVYSMLKRRMPFDSKRFYRSI